MKFRPLHDRVLVRRVEQEAKSTGGIIIPDTAQEKPMEGEVIAVGKRCIRSTSRPETACCSGNGRALKSRSMAKN